MTLLQLYFSFKGRLSLKNFWIYWNIPVILLAIIYFYFHKSGLSPDHPLSIFFQFIILLTIWPDLAVGAKRLHDINRSAWWLLLSIIPVIGVIFLCIFLWFMPGTKGENEYGEAQSIEI